MPPSVYAIATMDTKGHELAYVADRIRAAEIPVVTIDVGSKDPPTIAPDIPRETIAACHPSPSGRATALAGADRGQAITAMGEALTTFLVREHEAGRVAGVIGIGGSGNTALITPAMRALPMSRIIVFDPPRALAAPPSRIVDHAAQAQRPSLLGGWRSRRRAVRRRGWCYDRPTRP